MLLKKADTVLDDAILESAKRSARIDIASGPLPLNQSCFFRRPKTFFNSIDPTLTFPAHAGGLSKFRLSSIRDRYPNAFQRHRTILLLV